MTARRPVPNPSGLVTDAAVEKAAAVAYQDRINLTDLRGAKWADLPENGKQGWRMRVQPQVHAAAPDIAAKALRDAADAIDNAEGPGSVYAVECLVEKDMLAWLRDRADAIEGHADQPSMGGDD